MTKKKNKETKDVQVQQEENTGLVMQSDKPMGFNDGEDKEDLIIPRAKLLQAMSPEIVDELPGLKVGDIINSVTKEKLPATFVPIFMFKNWARFNPRQKTDPGFDNNYEGGQMIWRSDNPNDPRVIEEAQFGPNGEKPLAYTFMNFFAIFEGVPTPIIVSFSSTSYKAGKQLYSIAKFAGVDMFARKYSLGQKKEAKGNDKYFVLTVNPAGVCTQDQYDLGLKLFKDFGSKKSEIQVHDEADEQRTNTDDGEVHAEPLDEGADPFQD